MDDRDDRQPDDENAPDPTPSTGPATDRVRIVGAEVAGEATSVIPAVTGDVPASVTPVEPGEPGESVVRLTDERVAPEGDDSGHGAPVQPLRPGQTAVPHGETAPPGAGTGGDAPEVTPLPHWTEPPTGQVPAVLVRDGDADGGRSGVAAPAWREEDSDWVAHEDEFDSSIFAADETALGSLDETNATAADRRPWEFDLPSDGGTRSGTDGVLEDDDITEQVQIVEPRDTVRNSEERPLPTGSTAARTGGAAAAAASAAAGTGADDWVPGDPDGADGDEEWVIVEPERSGRGRRASGRVRPRARRPEGADDNDSVPLAAEPPGASVTDVPGVGLKRGGVAGLAAADRTADQEAERAPDAPDAGVGVGGPGTGAASPGKPSGRTIGRVAGNLAAGAAGAVGAVGAVGRGDTPSSGGGPPRRRPAPAPSAGSSTTGAPAGGAALRVVTGVVIAVIALVAFSLGTVPSVVLCTVVVVFAAGECFGALRHVGYHPATLLGLVGTVSLMIAAYTKGPSAIPLVLVLIMVFTFLWYLVGVESGAPVAGAAATMLTVGWISLLGSFAALLLAPSIYPDRHGIAFLLGAIIATVANDVGGLVVGGWLGRHPLAPSVSPNKTWEGLAGGMVLSIIVSAAVVGQVHPWTIGSAALLGLVVAVVAPVGDLCESLLKRDLQIKDMGSILPGHGGVLDRMDALLFVLPATYYLVHALNLG